MLLRKKEVNRIKRDKRIFLSMHVRFSSQKERKERKKDIDVF